MLARLQHIRRRRADLRSSLDFERMFEAWEESCVPSYCHRNLAAAYVSWLRLFQAVELANKYVREPRCVLDFGASVGELGHLVAPGARYEFIEQDGPSAAFLQSRLPAAAPTSLESAAAGFDQIFAIDSLEHNDNYAELLGRLSQLLAPGGVLVLSGPTENWLYRLGRRIAGYSGHYHKTTIRHIERAAEPLLRRRELRVITPVAPLFRISAWSRTDAAGD